MFDLCTQLVFFLNFNIYSSINTRIAQRDFTKKTQLNMSLELRQ